MRKCLFLFSLCLVPFVVFSSTFTSQNPIDLPTTTNSGKSVLDVRGEPLKSGWRYRIVSIFRGALGGDVYLDRSPNSTTFCPNGVFRYNSDVGFEGTPVKFFPPGHFEPDIFENQYINIQFTTEKSQCVDYLVWKVGDYDVSLGARLLETGGNICRQCNIWFKIVKAPQLGYNLLYCPGPLVCPSCPVNQCQAVGEVNQNGRRRLALVKDQPLGVNFSKV